MHLRYCVAILIGTVHQDPISIKFRMLNAFLTPLRNGISYFTPKPKKAATDKAERIDVLATPQGPLLSCDIQPAPPSP